MVITGGEYTMEKVSEYNEDCFIKELPHLITGRRGHGCSSYVGLDVLGRQDIVCTTNANYLDLIDLE